MLKRALSPGFLAKADLVLSSILGLMYFGPSIFTRSFLNKDERLPQNRDECFLNNIFKCLVCGRSLALDVEYPPDKKFDLLSADVLPSSFECRNCGFVISEHDGIFDFR
jgi:5-methylcytosine-specific restriction endonuclease McrA